MAKHNQKSNAKVKDEDKNLVEETVEMEETETTEVAEETVAIDKKVAKAEKKQKTAKVKVNREPRKSKFKEVFAELKKVNWPSFGKTMKQTGMVLSIVLIFGVVVLGFDTLISWLLGLLTKI